MGKLDSVWAPNGCSTGGPACGPPARPRSLRPSRRQPVGQRQARDSGEVPRVVSDHRQIVNQRRGCDQKVRPGQVLSLIQEPCLEFAELASDLGVDVQDGDVGKEGQQPLQPAWRSVRAETHENNSATVTTETCTLPVYCRNRLVTRPTSLR